MLNAVFGVIITNTNMERLTQKARFKLPGPSFQNYHDLLKFQDIIVRNAQ